MRLAVVLVHYHTPDLAAAAVEALAADLAGTGLAVEWLLVDNGSDEEERARLAGLPVRRIDPGDNLGFAGGVNLGVARSSSELILLMNPDVLVLPGCVPALLDALRTRAAVAGPRFFWDHGRKLLLPPAERRGRGEEFASLLGTRGGRWAAWARRRWRWHARRHWEARSPLASHALSGSLIALSRPAWERVGPFDDGFRLFFEETDWLLRARQRGVACWYVPAAEAVHLYGRSTAQEPRSRVWFEESARRFRRRHYGDLFTRALEGLDRRLPRRGAEPQPPAVPDAGLPLPEEPAAYPLWAEVSPSLQGFPAAAERLAEPPGRPWSLPAEIAGRLSPGTWSVQVTDARGRELLRRSLRGELRGAG
jgi:GT2 family glycosyltransferase